MARNKQVPGELFTEQVDLTSAWRLRGRAAQPWGAASVPSSKEVGEEKGGNQEMGYLVGCKAC